MSISALQDVNMCSIDPIVSSSQMEQYGLEPAEKCVVSFSQRYRPERNLAWMIAFVTSYELFPHVDQMG